MNDRRDFGEAWRAADEALARVRPSSALDDRLGASLSRTFPRLRVLAVSAVLAAVVLAGAWASREEPRTPSIAAQELAIFEPPSCAPEVPSAELELASGCRVVLDRPTLSLEARTRAVLKRTHDGVRVLEGTIAFEVEKVNDGGRVVVHVSGGRIEVIGTRFVVRESREGGDVVLEEGSIRFVGANGSRLELAPGWVHAWGTVAAPAVVVVKPEAEPAASARVEAPGEHRAVRKLESIVEREATPQIPAQIPESIPAPISHELDDAPPPTEWSVERTARAVERVSELRAEGRYEEEARLIARLLQAPLQTRAAEVLSFELGELFERKLLRHHEACAHWIAHFARFGEGRYSAELKQALALCRTRKETSSP